MKLFSGALVVSFVLACASSRAQSEAFIFKFATNQPLTYSVELKDSTTTSMNNGQQNLSTISTFDIHYKIKLLGLNEPDHGVTTVSYKPFDFEGDSDIRNSTGHFVSTMRDFQVRGTQNGIVLFDTEKGIGLTQAKKFRNEMVTFFLSGQMDFDASGQVKAFYGDLPFIDFWNESMKTQIGFFGIAFTNQPVGIGDSWQKTVSMDTAGQVKLDGDKIICTNTYTRLTNSVVDGRTLATFVLNSPIDASDLTGHIEQPGQDTGVDISEFSRDGTGVYHFDQKGGLLTDSSVTTDGNITMTALVQGRSSTAQVTTRTELQIKLLPAP